MEIVEKMKEGKKINRIGLFVGSCELSMGYMWLIW
jgi:hypothetical protein